MTESNAQKAIARVLGLDEKATSGSWRVAMSAHEAEVWNENHPIVRCDDHPVEPLLELKNVDANLIAEYRTLCPRLARALRIAMEGINSQIGNFYSYSERQELEKVLSEIEKVFEG